MIKNSKGHTLIEILIVLVITSTLLLFFSNSLLNNLRFINKYQRNTLNYTILRLNQELIPLFESSLSIKEDSLQYEFKVPTFKEENKYRLEKISFSIKDNQLIKKTGETEREKKIKLNNIEIKIKIEDTKVKDQAYQPITLEYSLSNKVLYTYNLKNYNYRKEEKK